MDVWFIVFIIFLIIVVGVVVPGTVVSHRRRRDGRNNEEDAKFWRLTLIVGVGLVVGLFFMSSFKIVGAKQIGVPVTFGKPSGSVMHNGWNWKSPATAVHVFDGSLQSERYSSDKDDQGDPITVRLFTGAEARVNVTFQWKLDNDNTVKQIYLNYKNPDNININLVKRALQGALNDQFSTYNPYSALIAAQAATNGTNTPGTQQVSISFLDMQTKALQALKNELGSQGVNAVSLRIAGIAYDTKTQDNLNSLGNAITQTQIALQNEKTATANAAANTTLNNSLASNATLQQLCIQMSQKVLEDGHQLNAAWNCFGASTGIIANK